MGAINQVVLLAANDNDSVQTIVLLIELALVALAISGVWATFTKAGQPGWGSIIPIYNVLLLLRVAGRPTWWILLFLIPFVNIVIGIIVGIDVARNFGKGIGFGLGLSFFGFIFYPILGFGNAPYAPAAA